MNLRKHAYAAALVATTLSLPGLYTGAAAATKASAIPDDPKLVNKVMPSELLTPVEIPADLQAKLQALPKDKLEFITSGRAKRVVKPPVMFERFRQRSSEDIAAYIDAMMSVAEQTEFKEGRDLDTIPLDTSSPAFNAWKIRRPQELNPKREPGPIELSRYVGGRGSGFLTFANAQAAITPADLVAGKVEVAIVGAPLDMGSGWRDARNGPLALRMAGGAAGNDMYTMINPNAELKIVDYGDIAVDNLSTERSMEHVREVVREIAQAGAIPIIIGGDHSLEYPNLAGIADVHGKGKVGVVHFDSHYDAGRGRVHLIDHGQPVYRAFKEGHVYAKNYVQVGLRARGPDTETFQWMRELGMRYHTMVEVEKRGWQAVMERAIKEAREGTDKLYISFDIDVLDPAFMTGTGTPVPGGLTMREAQPIMRRLCAETNIVGIDIVEVAPVLDTSYLTALNSNYLLNACLTGIAMHKKGITDKHFLSPLSSDHGQDNYYGDRK